MKRIPLMLSAAVLICSFMGCENTNDSSKFGNPFPEDIAAARSDVRKLFEANRTDYPDFYAGNYITEDKQNLIVQFTTDDTSEYDYLLEEHPCIKFNKVEFNLDELWEMYFEFNDSELDKQFNDKAISVTVSEEYNCLEVSIYPDHYTEENIAWVSTAMKDYPIKITENTETVHIL